MVSDAGMPSCQSGPLKPTLFEQKTIGGYVRQTDFLLRELRGYRKVIRRVRMGANGPDREENKQHIKHLSIQSRSNGCLSLLEAIDSLI